MPLLAALAAALAWLGRQGTRAVAASLFIGVMLPPLAALLKPIFAYALFALLCLAFLRVDPAEVRAHFSRPALVARGRRLDDARHAAADRAFAGRARHVGPPARPLHRDDPAGRRAAGDLRADARRPDGARCRALARDAGRLHRRDAAHRAGVRRAVRRRPAWRSRRSRSARSCSRMLAGAALVAWLVRRFAGQPWIDGAEGAHRRAERHRAVFLRGRPDGRRARVDPQRAAQSPWPDSAFLRASRSASRR